MGVVDGGARVVRLDGRGGFVTHQGEEVGCSVSLSGISSPSRVVGMVRSDVDADGLKHFLGQHRDGCGHADNELASGRERNLSSRGVLQAADLVISQPVVDEGQQLARDGNVRLLFAAARRDGVEVGTELGAAALFADRFDRGPPH